MFSRQLLKKKRVDTKNLKKLIEVMKKLDHPNVVRLHELIVDPSSDKLYLVMEYVDHGQVMDIDAEGVKPLDAETTWRYMRALIDGMEYCHENGVVHRDLKPENLLVTSKGTLKISDFGVSEAFSLDPSTEDIMSRTVGTTAFMAPEMVKASSADSYHGPPVDVWAAGITLYCFLFGKPPFVGQTIMETYDLINTQECVPARRARAD